MPTRWYHSLYWKVAIGFVVCLAAVLVAQGILFVWVVSRAGPTLTGQPPDRFAQTVARDLADALEREPTLDVAAFIKEEFGRDAHPFFIMLPDGRVFSNAGPFPEQYLRMARGALQRPGGFSRVGPRVYERGGSTSPSRPAPPPADRGALSGLDRSGAAPSDGSRPPLPDRSATSTLDRFPRRGPRGDPYRPKRPVPILVGGQIAGVVVVPPVAPFPYLLKRYAPTLALVAGGALVIGAVLAAIVIFGPTRRRLQAVETAARRLGAGDLSARVPVRGGDEVTAVATAFNAMADDLSGRADELAAADRARRQLLADVSHELTTPVTAMRGYLETLTMPEFALDEATRSRYLEIISDETGRLEHIIGDLLDLARLEGGGGAFVDEDVPTEPLFARVVARHERASRNADVRIVTVVEEGAGLVRGDRDRLEQALQNLAANALRYAPAETALELRAIRGDDGTIGMTVSDQGPGIPPEHQAHIFDRFYKVEQSRAAAGSGAYQSSRPAPGGSGLGLSIVKAIVERLGGRVSVTSRPGRTTFEIAGLAPGRPGTGDGED